MQTIQSLTLLVIALTTGSGEYQLEEARCSPRGYCVSMYQEKVNLSFDNARANCVREQKVLLSVTDREIQDLASDVIASYTMAAWIGGRRSSKAHWETVRGQPLDSLPADQAAGMNCLRVTHSSNGVLTLVSDECTEDNGNIRVICQSKISPDECKIKANLFDNYWNGTCYALLSRPGSHNCDGCDPDWFEAQNICRTGGWQDVLKDLIRTGVLAHLGINESAWTGYWRYPWTWIDRNEIFTYFNWSVGFADSDYDPDTQCTQILPSGQWTSVSCDTMITPYFVCFNDTTGSTLMSEETVSLTSSVYSEPNKRSGATQREISQTDVADKYPTVSWSTQNTSKEESRDELFTDSNVYIYSGVAAGVVVLVAVVVAVVCVRRTKRSNDPGENEENGEVLAKCENTKTNLTDEMDPEGLVSSPEVGAVSPYGKYDVHSSNNGQPNHVTSDVKQYEDVMLSHLPVRNASYTNIIPDNRLNVEIPAISPDYTTAEFITAPYEGASEGGMEQLGLAGDYATVDKDLQSRDQGQNEDSDNSDTRHTDQGPSGVSDSDPESKNHGNVLVTDDYAAFTKPSGPRDQQEEDTEDVFVDNIFYGVM